MVTSGEKINSRTIKEHKKSNIFNNFGFFMTKINKHNINEVYFLCKNAIVLHDGKEIERNTVRDLIDNPKTEIVKRMVKYSSTHGMEHH